jgi:hypothetical protein
MFYKNNDRKTMKKIERQVFRKPKSQKDRKTDRDRMSRLILEPFQGKLIHPGLA